MDKIVVWGGAPLRGRVTVDGSKNAALPIIAACLLVPRPCRLDGVPGLDDVATMCEVVRGTGARVAWPGRSLAIDSASLSRAETPYDLTRRMRASFLVMGPLLARTGRVRISLPGGCAIGARPIDLHLKGLSALGAGIEVGYGYVEAKVPGGLTGRPVYLDFPSVGATENVMMAACLASGVTTIENAALEPEVVDLAHFLNAIGCSVTGAGTSVIRIEGTTSERLTGVRHCVIPDRIEAGTLMVGAAITGGDVVVENVVVDHVKAVVAKLVEAGASIEAEPHDGPGSVRVVMHVRPKAFHVKTLPYPGFPTDMQAPFTALACFAGGTSLITETVFENRFMHVPELVRMGASVRVDGRTAVVEGRPGLTGASVKATDLRAGAALVLAGLAADGRTEVSYVHHVDRGYAHLDQKLSTLGAAIHRLSEDGRARSGSF